MPPSVWCSPRGIFYLNPFPTPLISVQYISGHLKLEYGAKSPEETKSETCFPDALFVKYVWTLDFKLGGEEVWLQIRSLALATESTFKLCLIRWVENLGQLSTRLVFYMGQQYLGRYG